MAVAIIVVVIVVVVVKVVVEMVTAAVVVVVEIDAVAVVTIVVVVSKVHVQAQIEVVLVVGNCCYSKNKSCSNRRRWINSYKNSKKKNCSDSTVTTNAFHMNSCICDPSINSCLF